MNVAASKVRTGLLIAASLSLAGCGKSEREDKDNGKQPAAAKNEPATAPAAAPAALVARRLPNLPLQADVAESWKIEEDKVAPEGGARLSTKTGEVSVMKDGVGGVKKMTLEDEKALMNSLGAPPQDVKEEPLGDGWVLSYKTPGILPFHATVHRTIDAAAYRCVIISEGAAQLNDGIAVCKSLRP